MMVKLERKHMLAAEIYGYSYTYYAEHLELGNARFTHMMPGDVEILERAEQEDWDDDRLAQELGVPEDKVELWRQMYAESKSIVDAGDPSACFQQALTLSIQSVLQNAGLDEFTIERLTARICYRVADLGFQLDEEGKKLSDYSRELRQKPSLQEWWLVSEFGDLEDEPQT
jgi:hypothetical protein